MEHSCSRASLRSTSSRARGVGRLPRALIGALAGMLFAAAPASANDSSFGGAGAALVPLTESRVQMVSEDITMTLDAATDRWVIEARYVFANRASSPVDLQVGFPERACPADSDCSVGHWTFRGLRTEVDGQEVAHRIGRLSRRAGRWVPRLGRVHLFDVHFAPGQERRVVHRYRMGRSTNANFGEELAYITRTGALWNGPIERARFTIRLPWRPWRIALPAEYRVTRYVETPDAVGRGATTELVLENHDWTPTADLNVHLSSAVWIWDSFAEHAWARECPSLHAVNVDHRAATDPSVAWHGRMPRPSGDEEVRERHFGSLSPSTSRMCRNLVFAAHGRAFRDATLRRVFYEDRPTRPFVFADHPERWQVLGFRPNPSFSERLLTPAERVYLRLARPPR